MEKRGDVASILSIFDLFETLNSPNIAVQQERCISVRNRNASCMRCAEACTSGCIALVDNELTITPENCIGCGTCATMCPTCALEALNPNDRELTNNALKAMTAAGGEAVLTCEQVLESLRGTYDPEKVVSVTCLGRVDETLIAALVDGGARHVSLVKASCADCAYKTGLYAIEAVNMTINTLLAVWGKEVHVEVVERLPEQAKLKGDLGYDQGRREFFVGLKGGAQAAVGKIAERTEKKITGKEEEEKPKYIKVLDDGTLPQFVPTRRERLLKHLASFGMPQDNNIDTRLWGPVVIDTEICDSCQMCATFCPTGALKKLPDQAGDAFGVEHTPCICVKCRCCEDICRPKALVVADDVETKDIVSMRTTRYTMKQPAIKPGSSRALLHSMRNLLDCNQVYER
jgi:ferredoxin